MGLSFCVLREVHTGIGFSYSGFHDFRHRIARSIGFKDAYSGTDTDIYETGRYKEIETTHPLHPFMTHEDCDGDLSPEDCGKVGAYLKELISEWEKELEGNPSDLDLKFDLQEAKKLSDLMLNCYTNGETLLFR
jgi:hypothetical protein